MRLNTAAAIMFIVSNYIKFPWLVWKATILALAGIILIYECNLFCLSFCGETRSMANHGKDSVHKGWPPPLCHIPLSPYVPIIVLPSIANQGWRFSQTELAVATFSPVSGPYCEDNYRIIIRIVQVSFPIIVLPCPRPGRRDRLERIHRTAHLDSPPSGYRLGGKPGQRFQMLCTVIYKKACFSIGVILGGFRFQ